MIIGLIISVGGILALGFYAINGLSWKKNANKEIDEEKELKKNPKKELANGLFAPIFPFNC